MSIHVRRADLRDLAVVIEFNRLLALESEHKVLDGAVLTPGVAAVLADAHKGIYFVAEHEGQIVGQLAITLEWSDWRNGWFWWIQSVYVVQTMRRQGVFRSLYEHVERAAKADPEVIGIRLYVERDNQVAQRTYLGLGLAATQYVLMEKYPLGE